MSAEHFVLAEDEVIDTLLLPGWREEIEAGDIERARREVREHLDRFCADGMRVQIRNGRRFFDPVALNFITTQGLTVADPFWRTRVIPPRRRAALLHAPNTPPTERFHDPRRVSLTIQRQVAFPTRRPGSKVILSLPLPVEEETQRELVVTPLPLAEGRAEVERDLLVVRTSVDEEGCVRFGVRVDFTAYQHTVRVERADRRSGPLSDPALLPYLAREEGLVRISSRIEAIARRFTTDDPWETVLAFWDHIFETKKLGSLYHYALDEADPLGLAGEWVDCYVGSALLVALARAAGIPARLVQGVLMYPATDQGHHYWSEVHIPPYGWVPLDLHAWTLAAGDARATAWSRLLVGHLPYQLVTLRLPRQRLELGGRYPRRWYSISKLAGAGQQNSIHDLDTGAFVMRDTYEATIGTVVIADPRRR